jgi:PAS domain S-box-containing protein
LSLSSHLDCRAAASGVRNSDGSIDRFVLVFGDITDSKQAEELLRRQAELLNQSHDAILTWKISGPGRGIVYWSKGAETLYGYTAAQARGRISHELLHARAAIPMEEIEAEIVQNGSWRGDLTHTTRDGREIVVESRLVRVSYDGEPYALETNRDITERKRVEELVRRQAELLDQSHDAIFTYKTGGAGITYWSRGAERMYGYTAADAIGRDPHELLQTRSDLSMQEIEAQIGGAGSWHGELTHTTHDGRELVVESSHVRVFYDGQMHALESNRDITARKHAEEQIHVLMHEINHRSKNMLSLVQAIARQIAAREPEDFIEQFTERIQALAANQDLIIRNEWRGVDVEDLVRAQLAHFADLVGSRIAMHGAKLYLTAAAAQAIGLALHELATNAAKYGALSTDAGRIDVGWQLDGDVFTISWAERGGPPVQRPERRGFGSTVIQSMMKRSLNGEVQLDYAQSGLEWRLTCQATTALEQVRQLQ